MQVPSRLTVVTTLSVGVTLWIALVLVWGPAPPESRISLTPAASATEPDTSTRATGRE